ncbi:MAG: ATP-binding protein [Candidatus Odinarchaeia archaeon]
MMNILMKKDDEIFLEDNLNQKLDIGNNLIISNAEGRGIVIQLIEMNIVNPVGTLTFTSPNNIPQFIDNIKTTNKTISKRILRFKILKETYKEKNKIKLRDWSGWVPQTIDEVKIIKTRWILKHLDKKLKYNFGIGEDLAGEKFQIDAYDLQGITLIVGKKGSGKSHISKIIVSELIKKGCKFIIFDINDEYKALRFTLNDEETVKSDLFDKIITLTPGLNLNFSLSYVGMDVLYDVLTIPLRLPDASAISFRNIWSYLEKKKYLRINEFFKAINSENNPHVREALYRRMKQIIETNLFRDDDAENTSLDNLLKRIKNGGALVINLKTTSQLARIITVQTFLSKLQEMLEKGAEPLWIIAEEAHLYISKTAWEDIITRMRHLGAYQIYITNNPESLPYTVIRQSDNVFLFKLIDKNEIINISPATGLDSSTLQAIARALPFKNCLVTGEVTNQYPFIIKTKEINTIRTGATRLFLK